MKNLKENGIHLKHKIWKIIRREMHIKINEKFHKKEKKYNLKEVNYYLIEKQKVRVKGSTEWN